MNMKQQATVCDFCGSSDAIPFFSGPDRLRDMPGIFSFVQCASCGLFYQSPRLPWSELGAYYEGDYSAYDKLIRDYPPFHGMVKRVGVLKQRWFVERFCRGGSLLDVGCGTGLFLEEMQRSKRWQLSGLEPTKEAADYMHRRLAIPVTNDLFERAPFPAECQDVVTLWHVLEHVASPRYTLHKVWTILKPGGYCIFSVPNYESISRRLFGRFWVGWDLPRHLYVFPRPVLQRIVEDVGFRVVDVQCFLISYHSLGHSLSFWLKSWKPPLQAIAQKLIHAYYTPPVRIGVFPFQVLVERLGLATVTTWAIQKRED